MSDTFSAEDQAAFDAMREATSEPEAPSTVAPESRDTPEPEPVAQPEPPKAEPAAEKPPTMVPVAEAQRERERRRDAEARAEAAQKRLDEALALVQRFAPGQVPQQGDKPLPAFEQDPQAFIQGKFATLEQKIAAYDQWREQQDRAAQAQQGMQQLFQAAAAQEATFRQATPDYDAAVQHLIKAREQELTMLGITDPAQRQQAILQDRVQIAQFAMQAGKNVAEVAYEFAKGRGYAPKAAEPEVKPVAEAEEKLAMIERGQRLGAGLGNGSPPAPRLTAKDLATMTDAQFAAAEKKDPDLVRRLMTGVG